jgi:hypothetical protein
VSYWIKSLGVSEHWLDEDWFVRDRRKWFACPKSGRPSFEIGDRALIYASGHQKLIGAVEITAEARFDPDFVRDTGKFDGDRWPWVVEHVPLLVVPRVSRGPHLTRAGVDTLSIRSHSHLAISTQQYRNGIAGLAEAAGVTGEPYAALAAE